MPGNSAPGNLQMHSLQGSNTFALNDTLTSSTITSSPARAEEDEDEFHQWATAVQLDRNVITSIPLGAPYDVIHALQQISNQFPQWLAVENWPPFQQIAPAHRPLKTLLQSTLLQQADCGAVRLLQSDDPELSRAICTIFSICIHSRTLKRNKNHPTDMERNYTIDAMLAHLCECDENPVMEYSTEQQLRLPKTKNENFDVANIKADGILYLNVPGFRAYISCLRLRVAGVALLPGPRKLLEVVHCVVGFKQESSGKNQALMGIVSGLYQKKALNMMHQLVFGVFQLESDFLQVAAGTWRDGWIHVYSVGTYSLDDPFQVVQFYLVLRGIKQLAHVYLQELRDVDLQLRIQVMQNPPADEWAKDRVHSIDEDLDE